GFLVEILEAHAMDAGGAVAGLVPVHRPLGLLGGLQGLEEVSQQMIELSSLVGLEGPQQRPGPAPSPFLKEPEVKPIGGQRLKEDPKSLQDGTAEGRVREVPHRVGYFLHSTDPLIEGTLGREMDE